MKKQIVKRILAVVLAATVMTSGMSVTATETANAVTEDASVSANEVTVAESMGCMAEEMPTVSVNDVTQTQEAIN